MALTAEQKEAFYAALSGFYFEKDDTQVEVMFGLTDTNNDGRIDRDEFEAMLLHLFGHPLPGPLVAAKFDAADLDKDGVISMEELREVLTRTRDF